MNIRISLSVNGESCELLVPVHKTLLEVLREDLDLIGTKHGCELGECGTCTVLVDGAPVLSCIALPADLQEREITTVEGMADGARLHPLQQAFAELGAAQCGYCTPGILLTAKAVPGVYAVITGADLPRVKFGILPVSQDEEALCTEKVRMVGDAVGAVAAVDEETADRACRLIDVDYEPLPALMSIQESLAHPEVRIHEYGDGPNVHKNVALQFGDVEAAFAAADLVREDVFFYEGNTHLPMEQHAAVAHATADGKLTLWSSTQTPHYVHRLLAKILDMPAAHIRVIAAPVGGRLGGTLDPLSPEIAP